MSNTNTQALSDVGVSIWLDDLSRDRIESGNLTELIDNLNVVGVTTNPTIFQGAISAGASYATQVAEQAAAGASAEETVFALTTDDVRNACDIFMPLYKKTGGVDGRVSIEVSPELAHDTEGTIAQAQQLYDSVARENVLIKIPATVAGLPAITETIARGISVNVTLIFSLERYQAVVEAFLSGVEQALERGNDITSIHSVASFFVSRVDTAIDAQLDAIGTDEASALRSRAGVANARLAYQEFERLFSTERAKALEEKGMNVQRPLWASTGVKDPALPQTLYVTELAVGQTVNTMPEKTLMATADEGGINGDRVTGFYDDAQSVLGSLGALGISYDEVTKTLEDEGVSKFIDSWRDLLGTVDAALKGA
jgi:transaldolase